MLGANMYAQKSFNLFMSMGLGSIDNYDAGTVPYHIKGAAQATDWGMNYTWGRNQIQIDGRYFKSTLKTLEGTNLAIDANVEYLYRCIDSESNRFHFHTGGALKGYGEIKTVPALQNAAACLSIFGDIASVSMCEYDFAFNKAKTHAWLTAYGKLGIPIYGFAARPGYAYVYDGQGQDIIDRLFGGYEAFGTFFPGCYTDFGLWLNLHNGNRLGLNYRWDYISTGNAGTWRYDNAYHTVNLTFIFNIK